MRFAFWRSGGPTANASIAVSMLAISMIVVQPIQSDAENTTQALNLVVMDPMSLPLSCACVDGVGQRRYELLAEAVEDQFGRKVNLLYEESLQLALSRGLSKIDLVIGKASVVRADASEIGLSLRAMADLSNRRGTMTLAGVVLVNKKSRFKSLDDLQGQRVAIGSSEHDECHRLAKDLFHNQGVKVRWIDPGSIEGAVYAFADGEADAVVVSDFLPPLLEGCGKLARGATKTIGKTKACAGVRLFAAKSMPDDVAAGIISAVIAANDDPAILEALESRDGFAPLDGDDSTKSSDIDWTDWRGPGRRGWFSGLPAKLPDQPNVLWRSNLTGPAMAGISATEEYVVVADKSADFQNDLFRAFDTRNGKPVWTVSHPAGDRMEYTNAPRATPVIVGSRVLLQSAFGKLFCVSLDRGEILWTKDLVSDFGGKVPNWGYSVPPLVIDRRVIVAPGSKSAALVALELKTGNAIWKTPGHAPAYAPFIEGKFGGRRQIVGYDSAGLGGWDPQTGQRLWEMIPPDRSDFHVGTPVAFASGVLVATENNATRWYGFGSDGRIKPTPMAENIDCAPDTCTPVVVSLGDSERIFCTAYGELFCIDGDDKLNTRWSETDERFYDHTCLVAGNQRVLLWSSECDLILLNADSEGLDIVSQWRPMRGEHPESMSHPALVKDRIYLRSQSELICIQLSQ